jgi:hypothetical protein
MQNFNHKIGFWEKRQFFRQKLSKIAENCDHNIDPRVTRLGEFLPIGWLIPLSSWKFQKQLSFFGYFFRGAGYV